MNTSSQEQEWFLARDGKRYGPISHAELNDIVVAGYVQPDDLLWRYGFEGWIEASQIKGLLKFKKDHPSYQENPKKERRPLPVYLQAQDASDMHRWAEMPALQYSYHKKGPGRSIVKAGGEPVFSGKSRHSKVRSSIPQKPVKKKSLLRRAVAFILYIALFMTALLMLLPAIVPTDWLKDQVLAHIEKNLGHPVHVQGKTTLSLLPSLRLQFNDVVFIAREKNEPEKNALEKHASEKHHGRHAVHPQNKWLNMEALRLELNWLPLFHRKLEVETVTLVRPKLSYAVAADGRHNWFFWKSKTASEVRFETNSFGAEAGEQLPEQIVTDQNASLPGGADIEDTVSPAKTGKAPYIESVSWGKIQIVDGVFEYQNKRTQFSDVFQSLNFQMTLPKNEAWLNAKGKGVWKSRPVEFTANLSDPKRLIEGQAASLGMTIKSEYFVSDLNGRLSLLDGWFFTGESELQVRSLRHFLAWMGHKASVVGGLGPFSLRSKLEAQAHRISFKETIIALDSSKASGQGTLLFSGVRPYLKADLVIDHFDILTYGTEKYPSVQMLSGTGSSGSEGKIGTGVLQEASAIAFTDPELTTGSLAPEAAYEEISARPVNSIATGLEALDADLKVVFQEFCKGALAASQMRTKIEIQRGILNAEISDFMIAEGKGKGNFSVDGTKAIPSFSANVSLQQISALPFFKNGFNIGTLSGLTDFALELQGAGHTRKQILASLSGKGAVQLQSGVLEGFNVQQVAEVYQKGGLQNFDRSLALKTEFKTLSGQFQINQGVLANTDFQLASPAMDIKGSGTYDFSSGVFDFLFKPIVSSSAAQAVRLSVSTLQQSASQDALPIRLKGTLEDYSLLPAASGEGQKLLNEGAQPGIGQDAKADKTDLKAAPKPEEKKVNKQDFEALLQGILSEKKTPKNKPELPRN